MARLTAIGGMVAVLALGTLAGCGDSGTPSAGLAEATAPATVAADAPASATLNLDAAQPVPLKGAPAEFEPYLRFVLDNLDAYWKPVVGDDYVAPTLDVYTGSRDCGASTVTVASGPVYCPRDRTILYPAEWPSRRGVAFPDEDFQYAVVLAHEFGHHLQTIAPDRTGLQLQPILTPEGSNIASIREELQADCYAGIWSGQLNRERKLDLNDAKEAILSTGRAGDDVRGIPGRKWGHGSARDRIAWFAEGWNNGTRAACDTSTAEVTTTAPTESTGTDEATETAPAVTAPTTTAAPDDGDLPFTSAGLIEAFKARTGIELAVTESDEDRTVLGPADAAATAERTGEFAIIVARTPAALARLSIDPLTGESLVADDNGIAWIDTTDARGCPVLIAVRRYANAVLLWNVPSSCVNPNPIPQAVDERFGFLDTTMLAIRDEATGG
ncbi:MAG: neutral zinc metallopeptidase [Thermoleophilia bacterium]